MYCVVIMSNPSRAKNTSGFTFTFMIKSPALPPLSLLFPYKILNIKEIKQSKFSYFFWHSQILSTIDSSRNLYFFIYFYSSYSISSACTARIFNCLSTSSTFCALHLNLHRTLFIVHTTSSTTCCTARWSSAWLAFRS